MDKKGLPDDNARTGQSKNAYIAFLHVKSAKPEKHVHMVVIDTVNSYAFKSIHICIF